MYGGISINKYILISIFIVITSAVFFAGCVEKAQTQVATPTSTQMVTPSPTLSPTPIITTVASIPTPIPTQSPKNLNIQIKAGYTLYQNDEYSYGFGYPKDWDTMGDVELSDNMLGGVGFSHFNNVGGYAGAQGENGGAPTMDGIIVAVYSSEPKIWWNEMYGGLDNASKAGVIISAKNTTVNGRKAFEVVGNILGSRGRWVIIQANNYYYVMNLYATVDNYSGRSIMFDDVVNSWVIGDIQNP